MQLRLLCSAILIFVFTGFAEAQYSELGILAGASNYKGELSPHLFNTDFLHLDGGLFFRHNWNRRWSYKLELNYAKISGDDAKATNAFALDRNLSFFSDILEISPQIEFNFFQYETGYSDLPFTPYVFFGLSIFHFNPKTDFGNQVVELQPLATEGHVYHRLQFALPMGGGLKLSLGRVGIGIEIGARRAYTDYLDDVSSYYPNMTTLLANNGPIAVALSDRSFSRLDTSSAIPLSFKKQRGSPNDNDWYLISGITIYFRLSSALRDICSPFKKRHF